MNLSVEEINKFKSLMKETREFEINQKLKNMHAETATKDDNSALRKQRALEILYSNNDVDLVEDNNTNGSINFNILSRNLKQLEELRRAGLINDQEYQQLKKSIIK